MRIKIEKNIFHKNFGKLKYCRIENLVKVNFPSTHSFCWTDTLTDRTIISSNLAPILNYRAALIILIFFRIVYADPSLVKNYLHIVQRDGIERVKVY